MGAVWRYTAASCVAGTQCRVRPRAGSGRQAPAAGAGRPTSRGPCGPCGCRDGGRPTSRSHTRCRARGCGGRGRAAKLGWVPTLGNEPARGAASSRVAGALASTASPRWWRARRPTLDSSPCVPFPAPPTHLTITSRRASSPLSASNLGHSSSASILRLTATMCRRRQAGRQAGGASGACMRPGVHGRGGAPSGTGQRGLLQLAGYYAAARPARACHSWLTTTCGRASCPRCRSGVGRERGQGEAK